MFLWTPLDTFPISRLASPCILCCTTHNCCIIIAHQYLIWSLTRLKYHSATGLLLSSYTTTKTLVSSTYNVLWVSLSEAFTSLYNSECTTGKLGGDFNIWWFCHQVRNPPSPSPSNSDRIVHVGLCGKWKCKQYSCVTWTYLLAHNRVLLSCTRFGCTRFGTVCMHCLSACITLWFYLVCDVNIYT